MIRKKIRLSDAMFLVLPVLFALILGALLILISGENPLSVYSSLFKGAFIGRGAFANTLFSATPLIVTGLAIAIAFKANLFNMGVEGQMYMGAFASAWVGFTFSSLAPLVHILLCILAAAVAGALFALIPALLKGLLDVNEMVVTIMLNYVAILITDYLASFPFYSGEGFAATHKIAESAVLPRFSAVSQLNFAFIIALVLVAALHIMFSRTRLGFEIKALGFNRRFAEATGMKTRQKVIQIMIISGLLAGIAGSGEVLGVHHRFIAGFSPGYGWDGMTISLLGKHNPLGILAAAFFFGIMKNGGSTMELMSNIPRSLINILQGLMIFFLAVDYSKRKIQFFKHLPSRDIKGKVL